MTNPENEMKDLREKNNELVQKVQYWKMTAAQRENEKLELMKEINELRLKLSRIRSGGAAQARKLDAELQTASEEALNHLVLASGAVARTIELAKSYMRDRQELDTSSPRWSSISGTPNMERVHRVPPMMIGGQSIQPVVLLSRTILNTSNPRSATRSPSRNVTERAVPMHMLQDVYIPLTRIDATELPGRNVELLTETNNAEDSIEDLGLEDSISNERSIDESQNITEEEFEESRRLDAVTEDLEEEDETETPPRESRTENPLEGPSWLLDRPSSSKVTSVRSRINLEPDSTTQCEDNSQDPQPGTSHTNDDVENATCAFTPTVRRRKRTASPPRAAASPRLLQARRPSSSFRVLKVLVAKMRLEGDEDATPPKRATLDSPARKSHNTPSSHDAMSHESIVLSQEREREMSQVASPARRSRDLPRDSPAKKPVRFDAPSPNGSTDARVIVSEVSQPEPETLSSGDTADAYPAGGESSYVTSRDRDRSHSAMSRDSDRDRSHSAMSRDSHDSDSGGADEGRTRRARKAVTYKEKPLNRKMRR